MPTLENIVTPALIVDGDMVEANLMAMSTALPGDRLRPHVKAHKCTQLAKRQASHGHIRFCCATVREVVGMAAAGLGTDLLLANETLDASRLAPLEACVTVAVDSLETIEAAARAGGAVEAVLVDVNVGLPRCGCKPEDAGRLADAARSKGLGVRGVMGYEGHVVGLEDRQQRIDQTSQAMEILQRAHADVGGNVISAGGTGTYDINTWATEIQAGSYALMDTAYGKLNLPFRQALWVWSTVISVSDEYAVLDCGLKSLGMDHGNPQIEDGQVWFCSDEHTTFSTQAKVEVGDRMRVTPAHIDPTVAYHEALHVVQNGEIADTWPIDLRGW